MTRNGNTQREVSNFTKEVYYFEVYDQFQDTTKFASVKHFLANFYPEKDSLHILTLHSKKPIPYNKKAYPPFCYSSVDVYANLKNKILFLKYIIPSKSKYVCLESL